MHCTAQMHMHVFLIFWFDAVHLIDCVYNLRPNVSRLTLRKSCSSDLIPPLAPNTSHMSTHTFKDISTFDLSTSLPLVAKDMYECLITL